MTVEEIPLESEFIALADLPLEEEDNLVLADLSVEDENILTDT